MGAPKPLALLLSALLLAAAAPAAEPSPKPGDLLAMALSQPAAPFQGRVLLTRWEGAVRRSEEANVYFRPPQTYRLEFLTPDGAVDRVVLSDGNRREVQLKEGAAPAADRADAIGAFLTPADQRRLLLSNYTVALAGRETVLSRDAWALELTPVVAGKPRQRMLIDRASHVVLETRRSVEDAGTATQFTRFEPNATLPDALFAWKNPDVREKESGGVPGTPSDGWPQALPGGYSFVSANTFLVNDQKVRQFVYSDGLSQLSLFVTPVPVQAPPAAAPGDGLLDLRLPDAIRQWRARGAYVTAVGSLPDALLVEIQQEIN